MNFAAKHPGRISNLIVVDIAPKSYLFAIDLKNAAINHKLIIETMLNFDFTGITNRAQLDSIMSESIKSIGVRQFLLKNIKRNHHKMFEWTLNVKALHANLNEILGGVALNQTNFGSEIDGFSTLFIKGANSDYILKDDEEMIKNIFPYCIIETIAGAGHWIHVDQPAQLLQSVFRFLAD